jgi:hypothetical protein
MRLEDADLVGAEIKEIFVLKCGQWMETIYKLEVDLRSLALEYFDKT